MRQCEEFAIAYTIDDRESFEQVDVLHHELMEAMADHNQPVPVVICGCRCDLEETRVVSTAEGEELVSRLNAAFYETSALEASRKCSARSGEESI